MPSAPDLLVVGGGPAGCAAALHARAAGLSVELVWQPDRTARPVESLPPASRRLLADLGCWPGFAGAGWLASSGTRSAWGSPFAADRDSVRDPDGPGWLVDRADFDAFLRDQAAAAGVVLRPGRLHRLEVASAGSGFGGAGSGFAGFGSGFAGELADGVPVTGRFLVDASGRAAVAASRLGARRRYDDAAGEVPVATVHRYSVPGPPLRRTVLEAVPEGWWYTIGSATGSRTVGRISLPDEPASEPPPLIAAVLDGAVPVGGPRRVAANSGYLQPFTGPGWAAAGDAALSFDPLSSQGMLTALFTGRAAAEAAVGWLAGQPAALSGYAGRLAAIRLAYRRNLALHYGMELRWPASRFWAGRPRVA